MAAQAQKLRQLLAGPELLLMPCCFDGLSAGLIEAADFPLTFMSGFAVSAARIGMPDTGLISYGEMIDQGLAICSRVKIPVIGDGDTGYGNAINVKRTVRGYRQAGFAGVMIEDQVAPKRCGHTRGKQVVERTEALARIQAAVDARDEGDDIIILARTDARATHGLDEALRRVQDFAEIGADIVFLEAPQSEEEMRAFCEATPVPKLANMLEQGKTPLLPPTKLAAMGYKIAAYPLTLLSCAAHAMQEALTALKNNQHPQQLLDFDSLREVVGFNEYYREESRYAADNDQREEQ